MNTAMQIAPSGQNGESAVIAPDRGAASTAVAAASAQAKAEVEARYVIARAQPRDMSLVWQRLVKECQRPAFASVGMYARPVGKEKNERGQWVDKHVTGLSIRFAEAAIRCMGNVDASCRVLHDDPQRRLVRVVVTDLETNAHFSEDIVLEKTIERRKAPKGAKPIAQRTNSYGDTLYILPATELDMVPKQRAAESKAIRNCLLRLLPGDFQDDAKEAIRQTRVREDAEDPAGAMKRILMGFSSINIPADQLAEYVGHSLDQVTPAELVELRNVFAAVRDGEMAWHETLAERRNERSGSAKKDKANAGEKTLDDLKEKKPSPMPEEEAEEAKPKATTKKVAAKKKADPLSDEEHAARSDCAAAIEEIGSAGGKNSEAIAREIATTLQKFEASCVDDLALEPMRDLFQRVEALR